MFVVVEQLQVLEIGKNILNIRNPQMKCTDSNDYNRRSYINALIANVIMDA